MILGWRFVRLLRAAGTLDAEELAVVNDVAVRLEGGRPATRGQIKKLVKIYDKVIGRSQ